MSFRPNMSVANFTCRFGDKKVLLDLFNEVVYPSIFDSPPRVYRNNEFYLFDLLYVNAGTAELPEPIITGQFVRNTDLKRSHILRETRLIEDSDQIESATSARFVLVLSSHTLIYVTETPAAPPIQMFRSTIQYHLTKAWSNFLKEQAKLTLKRLKLENSNTPIKPKLKEVLINLIAEIPLPELEITQLPSRLSVEEFLNQFEVINRVEYKILDTNHSPNFTPLLQQLRDEKEATQSKEIIVIESKPKNKSSLAEQLRDATADGNVKAIVDGKTTNGLKLRGTNDLFSLTIPFENIAKSAKIFAKQAMSKFEYLLKTEEIVVHKVQGVDINKLKDITPENTLDV